MLKMQRGLESGCSQHSRHHRGHPHYATGGNSVHTSAAPRGAGLFLLFDTVTASRRKYGNAVLITARRAASAWRLEALADHDNVVYLGYPMPCGANMTHMIAGRKGGT